MVTYLAGLFGHHAWLVSQQLFWHQLYEALISSSQYENFLFRKFGQQTFFLPRR